MNYKEALEYIDSFINFEKLPKYSYASGFKLQRMAAFLEELGNPHNGIKVIHVAGSKGKGSTCVFAASLLKEAGYKAGLYTSPHLIDIRERIRILGSRLEAQGSRGFEGVIGKDEFAGLIERIKPAAEKFRDREELGKLSFFEILTACAFLYFRENKVDYAVMETGLGGRLDATNLSESRVAGITDISLEHTDKLGNSLELIAGEKAGIVKSRGSMLKAQGACFSALQEEEAGNVIRRVCKERKVELYEIGSDIKYIITESGKDRQVFDLDGPGYSYKDLEINLMGEHQVKNAALAVGMVKYIDKGLSRVDESVIRRGLKEARWPGRLQVIGVEPYVVLDGAQNSASMKTVLEAVKKIFKYKKLICVFGISSDKDIEGVTAELDKVVDAAVLTKAGNQRAKDPFFLKDKFKRAGTVLSGNVEEALKLSLKMADKEDLILVTGSLFVVGEAITLTMKP
jgi:dihydrofolate synthase / folylpolyglutamate synthase